MRTGALPPEGLITGRAVPTALRDVAAFRMGDSHPAVAEDQGVYTSSAYEFNSAAEDPT
jgi:hypothetical protein